MVTTVLIVTLIPAFQWKNGEYKNHVFFMDLTYEGKTLTMKARGNKPFFSATFRKK